MSCDLATVFFTLFLQRIMGQLRRMVKGCGAGVAWGLELGIGVLLNLRAARPVGLNVVQDGSAQLTCTRASGEFMLDEYVDY
jgi:hypothetical protein